MSRYHGHVPAVTTVNGMQLNKLCELRLSQPSTAERSAYLSAASGLVKIDSTLYVVADDELYLGIFPASCAAPGQLLRLFAGELPNEPAARKRQKPDFEALVCLPASEGSPLGALLALGSGSRHQRRRAALIPLTLQGLDGTAVQIVDFTAIFARLEAHVGEPNIEGAVVRDERLILMHRGNPNTTENCLVSLDLPTLIASMARGSADAPVVATRTYALRTPQAEMLGFTDGSLLPDGRLVFSAVAEDTPNSYLDGPCSAAALGVIAPDGQLQSLNLLEQPYKIEGIHAEAVGAQIHAWLVTDADDPAIPASLFKATWA